MRSTRVRFAKLRARKSPKPVPKWIQEKIKEEREQIREMYGKL